MKERKRKGWKEKNQSLEMLRKEGRKGMGKGKDGKMKGGKKRRMEGEG
jgi:hypothetical protein